MPSYARKEMEWIVLQSDDVRKKATQLLEKTKKKVE